MPGEYDRATALGLLAPRLRGDLLERALTEIGKIEERQARDWALGELVLATAGSGVT